MRANYGLRSLEQAPLLRQRIRSEEGRGNFAEAWELEQDAADDGRGAPRRLARSAGLSRDRRQAHGRSRALSRRRISAATGARLLLRRGRHLRRRSEDAAEAARPAAGCSRSKRSSTMRNATTSRAINVLLRQRRYADAAAELERNLIESSYVHGGPYRPRGSHGSCSGSTSMAAVHDRPAEPCASAQLRRRERQPLLNRATALVQVADWDLLFEHRPLALDAYEQTYEFLKQQGIPQAAIDELFSPATPVVLPTFVREPSARRRRSRRPATSTSPSRSRTFGTSRRHRDLRLERQRVGGREERARSPHRAQPFPTSSDGRSSRARRASSCATRCIE